ncbi:unnamed protein product [Adineta ricciae]|uniref:Alcohol acetyltransferase n=1 Tax=Adineta ricciae TaxID=249248 RepID=A0A815B5R8_ADIRI|nr:unnamed protein product [Adineta ricciae]CAF1265985.1 unnamed protein product [Adineta ricciae]
MDHRKVAPMEMYSVARHQLEFYKSVLCYLRFHIPSFSLSQWQIRIEQAIRSTITSQPRLRLQVDVARKEPFYIVLPMDVFDVLPLKILERTHDDEEREFLENVVTDECNTGFPLNSTSPLWRIVLVVPSHGDTVDLIWTYSHALADGISGMALFTSFVRCLAEKPTVIFTLDKDQPMNELIPYKLPPLSSLIMKIVENLILPGFLKQHLFPQTFWAGNIQLTGDEWNRTRQVSFQIPGDILDSLHKKCRSKQTTVHAALLASFILAVTDVFGKKNMEFSCGSAVNMRRFCHPVVSNEQIGIFVSAAPSYHYIPYSEHLSDLFWPLAGQIKEQITQEIENETISFIHTLKFVSDWKEMLIKHRKTSPNGYRSSVEISNLLRWTFETTDPTWKVLSGGFAQSANLVGGTFVISAVTVNDILEVIVGFQEHTFNDVDQVKLMKNRMKTTLVDAISL